MSSGSDFGSNDDPTMGGAFSPSYDSTMGVVAPTGAPAPYTWPTASPGDAVTGRPSAMPSAPVSRGTIIGEVYAVQRRLGAGGMGVVYQALHVKLERPVALKLHLAGDADAARLEREARAMARLSHPNVITVHDVGTWCGPDGEDHVFIAMELCDAGNMRDFIAKRPPWRQALAICRQAGEGLAAAHAAGLVHRDFKPDNVLMSSDGRVRVADFGLARALGTPSGSTHTPVTPEQLAVPSDQLTRTGAVVGTPAYMAPEQFGGTVVDARADQFAFAVVVYEALWGKRPYGGRSAGELLYQITQGRPQPPPPSDIPTAVWDALRRGLLPDPARRYPTMQALLAALDRAARATGPSPGALVLAIAIPVIAIAGVSTWWLLRTPSAAAPTRDTEPEASLAKADTPTKELNPGDAPIAAPGDPIDAAAPPADVPATGKSVEDALDELANADPWGDAEAVSELIERAENDDVGDIAIAMALAQAQTKTKEEAISPAWPDGETLTCGWGANYVVENKTITIDESMGPAIHVLNGCHLVLRNCNITAGTIVDGMNADVEIYDSEVTASHMVVNLMRSTLTIDGLVAHGDAPITGISLMGGTATLDDVEIAGTTALQAVGEVEVDLRNSKLTGNVHSIATTGTAKVRVKGTTLEGKVSDLSSGVSDVP